MFNRKRKTLTDITNKVEDFIGEIEEVATNARKDYSDTSDQIADLNKKLDSYDNEITGSTILVNNFRKLLTEELV